MKKSSKTLKITLVVLIVILLCIISFIGIYDKGGNNLIKGYSMGRNLEGSRVIKYVASELDEDLEDSAESNTEEIAEIDVEETENVNTDSDSKDITQNISDEEENKETTLTEENFIKSKEILQARIESLSVNDYEIRQNNETGDIYIILPDDSNIDSVKEVLSYTGSFEMKDADTNEVLLNNDDIASVKVGYGTSNNNQTSSSVSAYLTINFNKEGKAKLSDISSRYNQTIDEEGNTIEKKVSLTIEGNEIINTYFSEPMNEGKLQLSIGSSTSDTTQLQEYMEQGSKVAVVLDNGKLPLKYTLDEDEYIKSDITQNEIMIVVYVLIAIIALDIIYLIMKYKKNGVLSAISYITSIAIFLLLVRYTNTLLVIESGVAFISLIILNHYLYTSILNRISKDSKQEEVKRAFKEIYKSCIDLLIVLLVIAVVFVYVTFVSINSIGMLLFWGIISILVANFIFGRTLLIFNTQN